MSSLHKVFSKPGILDCFNYLQRTSSPFDFLIYQCFISANFYSALVKRIMNILTKGLWTSLPFSEYDFTTSAVVFNYMLLHVCSVNRMGKWCVVPLWIKIWFQTIYHPGHLMEPFLTSLRWVNSLCGCAVVSSRIKVVYYGITQIQCLYWYSIYVLKKFNTFPTWKSACFS